MVTNRDILQYPNEILTTAITDNVNIPLDESDKKICLDIYKYLKVAKNPKLSRMMNISSNAVGLAANQIGKKKRIFGTNFDGKIFIMVNPKIIEHSKKKTLTENGEGCLSVNFGNLNVNVPRYKNITIGSYIYDIDTNDCTYMEMKLSNLNSTIFQQELDHLNGKLIID